MIRAAVGRPVGLMMITIAVVALGLLALARLPVDLLPDLEYPRIGVETSFPRSSPEEVERLVTDRIEQEVSTVRALRRYSSVSTSDKSRITLEFDWGTRMDFARLDVREKLERARWTLPEEAGRPTLVEFDPSRRPFMTIALRQGGDPVSVSTFARRVVAPRLEQAKGVAAAEVEGDSEAAVFVRLKPDALSRLGITAGSVVAALGQANLRLPGGVVSEGHLEFYLSIAGEFKDLADAGSVVIARRGPTPVLLADVATLSIEAKPLREMSRLDGERCLLLRLRKMAGSNTIAVAGEVEKILAQIRQENPEVELRVIESDADYIGAALAGVREALLGGAILAFAVLFLFLRDWRSPLLMGITIPLSVVVAFIGLYAAGISLNVMSLGGLALGVGLLVDNGIVVLEAIHRRREMGLDARQAALTGTGEVAGAIIGGTLTNLVVFLPVIYVEGVAGQIFRDQALAVTFALLASLLVALTLVPALASRIRLSPRTASSGAHDILAHLRAPYLRALTWVLDHRPAVFAVSASLLATSLAAVRFLPIELLPVEETKAVDVEVSMEPGMPFDELARVTERMERQFLAVPGVRQTLARLGLRGGLEAVDGIITAYGDGTSSAAVIGPRLADAWAGVAGSITWKRRVTLLGDILGAGPHDLSVLVTGDEVAALREAAEALRHEVAGSAMIQQASVRWLSGVPEFRCALDLDLVSSAGLTPASVADAIQSVARGTIATTYYREEDRIEVILLAGEGEGVPWEEVLAHPVVTRHGLVPLRRFLRCRQETVPGEIEHINGERTVRILVDVKGANVARAAREVGAVAERFTPHARRTRISLGPEAAEMKRSLNSLVVAGLLAIALQFAVMVFEFESFRLPFVVMFTVPMGLVGVMAGLLVTGTSLGIVSGIGIVVLAGIVDNDAILLVDRTRQAIDEGMDLRSALMDAAQTRFRPVIMTTVTTVLGLLPMAFGLGEGAELRTGLAITILAGIIAATALTLLLVPALHLTFAGKAKQT